MKQNMKEVELTYDEKMTLGQCYNLAHAEVLAKGLNPSQAKDTLKETTVNLFKLKSEIESEVMQLKLDAKKIVKHTPSPQPINEPSFKGIPIKIDPEVPTTELQI